ncbi:MAG: SpoIIE family protein phosphatase [Verrucomicrobiota bacterium]
MSGSLTGKIERLSASLDLVDGVRQRFGVFLANLALPPKVISDWQLVLTELLTNAIVHGCGERAELIIEVRWELLDDWVSLSVTDPGEGPSNELIRDPKLPADDFSTHGRGLFLIASLVDEWSHWRGRNGYSSRVACRHPDMLRSSTAEELLDQAMSELSASYESIAAFYRLGDALVESETVLDFLRQAKIDLRGVAPHQTFRIYLSEHIQSALVAELAMAELAYALPESSELLQNVLDKEEFSWASHAEVAGDPNLKGHECGILCRVQVGGRGCGVLMLANRAGEMSLNAGTRNTIRTFADLIGIAVMNASNAQIRDRESQALRELEIASEMQDRLLPLPQLTQGDGWSAFVRRRTAHEVSGDHVEICESRGGDLFFCMIDVMGKGVPAAFLAAMFRTALHISLSFQYSLSSLVVALNRTLCRELADMTMFATCAIARVPKNLQKIEFINAGHCPILAALNGDELIRIEPSGPPLGLFPDAAYTAERFSLQGPASVFMVTDGLYEWERGEELWGWENFVEFLQDRLHEGPESVWRALRKEIDANGAPCNDDQTFLYWQKV